MLPFREKLLNQTKGKGGEWVSVSNNTSLTTRLYITSKKIHNCNKEQLHKILKHY